VSVASRGHSKGSHQVEALYGKGPGWRDCSKGLSRHVLLLGEDLAPFTSPNQFLGIHQGGGCNNPGI
jgi:hypothetical protein